MTRIYQAQGLDPVDRALLGIEHALRTCFGPAPISQSAYPATKVEDGELDEAQRRHGAGLMRINHAGEVCAQALYLGQAAVTRDDALRAHLLEAAREESDHLAWCAERLEELDSGPSKLNALWYAGSFAIGALAGAAGDSVSLGFIVETENQVEAHLGDHLERLPEPDRRSRAIVRQMQLEEVRHAEQARDAGAITLPSPIPTLMAATARLMKWAAYRF